MSPPAFSAFKVVTGLRRRLIYGNGYFCYGINTGLSTTDSKSGFVFDTETSFNPGSGVMPAARKFIRGFFGDSDTYFAGGLNSGGTPQTTIHKMILLTEADSTISETLDVANGQFGASSAHIEGKGYQYGGFIGGGDDVASFDFGTETAGTLSAFLDTNESSSAGVNSDTKGYSLKGENFDNQGVDSIIFATETNQTPSARFAREGGGPSGASSDVAGYVGPGNGSSISLEKLIFSSETDVDLGIFFMNVGSPSLRDGAALSAESKSYWGGGGTSVGNINDDITSVTFTSETAVFISAKLNDGNLTQLGSGQQWRPA